MATCEALRDILPVPMQAVRQGFMLVDLPGRFQVLPGRPTVVLDVAHNPQAAGVLNENLASMGFFVARPVDSPYQVEPANIGSYFLFRVVFQDRPRDLASVKIYAYADRVEGPVLIHQASHPWPLPLAKVRPAYGFTGLQHVYEPMRDGELAYWCEQVKEGGR